MNEIPAARLKQPKVFPFSVTTALFERSGFYALTFILVLYMKSAFNISDHEAFIMFGVFNALVFLTPALGGYLADNVIGIRRTMALGLFLEALGLTLLSLPTEKGFSISLALVIIGVGLFKVGPTDLLGRSYDDKDPRIDSGFTLYYMAMNIGAFVSPIATGYLQLYFGWHVAFLFGAIVLYAGLIAFFILQHRAKSFDSEAGKKKIKAHKALLILLGVVVAIGICVFLLNYAVIANIFFALATAGLLIYFANEIRKSNVQERKEIVACLALIFIGMIFFVMYFQLFMSVTLFIKRSVSHIIFGFDIPSSAFLALNNIWVVLLSPFLVIVYNALERKHNDLAITTKFTLGIFITGLCFISLYISKFFPNADYQVAWFWPVIAIGLYSLGELLVSALGVAMVTRIAPKRMYGVMMGAWFLIATSLASAISSSVADLASIPDTITDPALILNTYGKAFLQMGLVGIGAAILVWFACPYIKKIANLK